MARARLILILLALAACGKNGDQRPPSKTPDTENDGDEKPGRAVTMKLVSSHESSHTDMLASGPGTLWVGAHRQGIELWNGDTKEREVRGQGLVTELSVSGSQPTRVYAAPQLYEMGAEGFRPQAPTARGLATGVTGLPSGSRYNIERASWSPDGTRLFVLARLGQSRRRGAGGSGSAPSHRLLEFDDAGQLTRALDELDAGATQRMVSSSSWLVVASSKLVAVKRGDLSQTALAPLHAGSIEAASFNADGSKFAVATMDGKAHLWSVSDDAWSSVATWQAMDTQAPALGRATALAFSPSAPLLAVGGSSGVIRLWQLGASGPPKQVAEYVMDGADGPGVHVKALAFSSDGKLLRASQSREQTIYVLAVD